MTAPSTTRYLLEQIEKVGASTFFGDRISEMSREELLGLVGWMQEEMDRMDDRRKREVAMERVFRGALHPTDSIYHPDK